MADFQIYVIDKSCAHLNICRDVKDFTTQQGRGKFQVSKEKLVQCLLPDGVLHLCCDVEYIPTKVNLGKEQQHPWAMNSTKSNRLRDKLKALYMEQILTDLDIYVSLISFEFVLVLE